MESLLRWAVENTTPSSSESAPPPPVERKKLDPEIIDLILGKSDAVLMKEAMDVATDEKKDIRERVVALDNMEMLIESIDNANNLANLKMWPPLFNLLSSSDDELLSAALWVCGTAVQNNPKAQNDFLAQDPLPILLSIISSSQRSAGTRSKAVYTLSGSLKHNAEAVGKMAAAGGWAVLKDALVDPEISVRRKIAFMLNTLLSQDGPPKPPDHASARSTPAQYPREPVTFKSATTEGRTRASMQSSGLLDTLIRSLGGDMPHGPDGDGEMDEDYAEKAMRCLCTYVEGPEPGVWTERQKAELGKVLEGVDRNAVGLSTEDWQRLTDSVR